MDSHSWAIIISLALLILSSAYFSASETAFSSLNKIRLKNMALKGHKRAMLTFSLSEDYDKLLSTILIGNNIVNIVAASLATVLFVKFYGEPGVAISTLIMTILVLIFGEITPKSMAKEFPEKYAMFSAPLLKVLVTILSPINFLLMKWKNFIRNMFKIDNDDTITEEELLTIVDEAQVGGTLEIHEHELIKSAIEFDNLDASYVMTPRVDLVSVETTETDDEIIGKFISSGFSRLPVYDDTIDNIIGILHEKDFYAFVMHGKKNVEQVIRPAVRIPITIKLSKLLKRLQQSNSHIAIVTDEYGGTEGIVTFEDIIEELVGEIWDEHDEVNYSQELIEINDKEYEVLGSFNLDKFVEVFKIDEEGMESSTVGGWVLEQLGSIPQAGDSFDYENLHVVVKDLDGHRVSKIMVTLAELND